jgi:hypothetical protein
MPVNLFLNTGDFLSLIAKQRSSCADRGRLQKVLGLHLDAEMENTPAGSGPFFVLGGAKERCLT